MIRKVRILTDSIHLKKSWELMGNFPLSSPSPVDIEPATSVFYQYLSITNDTAVRSMFLTCTQSNSTLRIGPLSIKNTRHFRNKCVKKNHHGVRHLLEMKGR